MDHATATRHLPPFTPFPNHWYAVLDWQETMVAWGIQYHSNRQGEAWPSVETLARETGISARTVRRAIRRLESLGILTVTRRFHRKYGCTTNIYCLDPRAAVKRVSRSADDRATPRSESQPPRSEGQGPRSEEQEPLPQSQHPPVTVADIALSEGQGAPVPGADKQDFLEQDIETVGEPVCVSRARAQAREGSASADHTHRRPPQGMDVLEIPRDLDWATGAIEAFWAAKAGERTAEIAEHLWEQLRAIAREGGPDAMVQQLREATAHRWRSIDAHAWRRYKQRNRPVGRVDGDVIGGADSPLGREIRESAAYIRRVLGMPPLEEDTTRWP